MPVKGLENKCWSTYKQIIVEVAETHENQDNWSDQKMWQKTLDRLYANKRLLETLLNLPHA